MLRFVDNIFLNILLWFGLVFFGIIVIFYLIDQFLKFKPFLLKAKNFFVENVFLLLLPVPFLYLIYYHGYFLHSKNTTGLFTDKETADFLKDLSIIFFTGGVATATLKYLNSVVFFKKQFTEVVQSKEFSEVLNEKMKILALSDEYLLQRNDLQDIWARVTICKYQQKFPELSYEIKHKMENDFFLENSLSYYYKNFRLQINFSLIGDIIKIVEISSFTVISHSTDTIELNFGTNSRFKDDEEVYTKLIAENCKKDGIKLDLIDLEDVSMENLPDMQVKRFSAKLEGQTRYIIERQEFFHSLLQELLKICPLI
jgi:hypothetical protein